MSVQLQILNTSLKWVEKPFLARVTEPAHIRRRFEMTARVWFHAPWGTKSRWDTLEHEGSSVPALWTGASLTGTKTVLYFHGGGYVFGSPRTHAAMLGTLARMAGVRACLPQYRLGPEAPFPGAVDDALAAYLALLGQGIAAQEIVIGGDSAGGGLALALLGQLLEKGYPLPAACFAFSPLTDLTFSGESMQGNEQAEVLLPAERAGDLAEMYLAGHDPMDPRASPLFADFHGAPPVWLAVGTTEILLDDTRRLVDRLTGKNVPVTVDIQDDLPHVWPIFHGVLPEARATLRELADWITQQWPSSDDS